jgi:hypothetical protein
MTAPKSSIHAKPKSIFYHGMSKSRVYRIWRGMINRCENPKVEKYPIYGGRGITVCPEWKNFTVFYADMGDPPSPIHQIDRIKNELGYFKGNCRWVTPTENNRNRRPEQGCAYFFQGKERSLMEIAKFVGIKYGTLHKRVRILNIPFEEAIKCSRKLSAKLSDADIPEIRRLAAEGVSRREIGRMFGVHNRTVTKIVNGEYWKHVTDKD